MITCVLYFPVVFLPQRLYFPCHFPSSCVVPAFPCPENATITCVLYFPVVFLPQRLYFPCHFPSSCVVPAFPYPENAPITYVLYFRMLTARFFRLLPNAGINILPIFFPPPPPPLYFFISLFSSHLLPFAPSSPPFFLSAAFSDTFSYRLLFQPSALFAAFFSCPFPFQHFSFPVLLSPCPPPFSTFLHHLLF